MKHSLICNFLFLNKKIAANERNADAMESAAVTALFSGIISPETLLPVTTNKNAIQRMAVMKR